jgi:predicted transcriptional regulator
MIEKLETILKDIMKNSIDNDEIKEIINMSKREIAEKIVNQEIIPRRRICYKIVKMGIGVSN